MPPVHGSLPDDIELAKVESRLFIHTIQNGAGKYHRSHGKESSSASLDEGSVTTDDEGDDQDKPFIQSPHHGQHLKEQLYVFWPQLKGIVTESAPTLFLSTMSLLFAGELLDQVSKWPSMQQVDQLMILVPVILNLKGNLEMNLSARLGTAANIGELNDHVVRRSIIIGNMTLLQVQAGVVSFVAACVSLILGRLVPVKTSSLAAGAANAALPVVRGIIGSHVPDIRILDEQPRDIGMLKSGLPTFILVSATAVTSTAISGFILGAAMCGLVLLCQKLSWDPDNIAPAIASCLGDLVTLELIGIVSLFLVPYLHTVFPLLVGLIMIGISVICFLQTLRNPHVKHLLMEGWPPLFGAMIISSGTGIVLDMFVSRYEGFALLAIVISGLPGAVGSIFVCRLSTALHVARLALPPTPSNDTRIESSPRLVILTLLIITLPLEILFLFMMHLFGWLTLPFIFFFFSVVFFSCAVLISLLVSRVLTDYLWAKGYDPDMYALPIHSALVDLLGQVLLVMCYELVSFFGARVRAKS